MSTTPTLARTVSIRPIVLSVPGRGDELQVRVTLPAGDSVSRDLDGASNDGSGAGRELDAAYPVVVFSHGYSSSMDAYGPLVDAWAAAGMAVIQPTHLDSTTLAVAPSDARTPEIWRWRIRDLVRVLDGLDEIEAAVPGRLDRERIAVAGHSWGATTASALLGAGVIGEEETWADPRVKAGVLLAIAGYGQDALSPFAAEHFPFMSPTFDALDAPALVVAGDADQSQLTTRGPDWWLDAYRGAPGAEALLTLHGAEHLLGGITDYPTAHNRSEADSPELVALVQRATTAYLRRALGLGAGDWEALAADDLSPTGSLTTR